jgi:hypothetical protein
MFYRKLIAVAAALVVASGCARYTESTAGGDVIDAAEAAKTVVLEVRNNSGQAMELRTVVNGRSQFIGSVGASDTTSILLDPMMFPTGFLYLQGIPGDMRGRAMVGPLSASKGDRIRFTILPALDMSHAIVIR